MSQLIKNGIIQQISRVPLIQFQRYRGKINIQRPRKPHYIRAVVNAVTQPIYPEPIKISKCFKKFSKNVQHNPYNDIIAREVRNWLDHSKMVAIFHLNSIKADAFFDIRVLLHKQNMQLKRYSLKIMEKAVENSQYEAILPLFRSTTCIVFSPEKKLSQLLKTTRKVHQMILLAGIVDNTLISSNEFVHYSKIPNIQSVQAELVQTLNTAAINLVQNFEAHQNNFVNVLDVYVKRDAPENVESADVGKTENAEE